MFGTVNRHCAGRVLFVSSLFTQRYILKLLCMRRTQVPSGHCWRCFSSAPLPQAASADTQGYAQVGCCPFHSHSHYQRSLHAACISCPAASDRVSSQPKTLRRGRQPS